LYNNSYKIFLSLFLTILVENSTKISTNQIVDSKSIEDAFKAFYKPLVKYAFSIIKDKDEAEDLVQQVFMNLLHKQTDLQIEISLRAYLYKAVYHSALNKVKQNATRIKLDVNSVSEDKLNYQEIYHDTELQEKIEASIESLPAQCARIFKMSRFEELKYQQIADELGLSIKTIENQMGKALKLLRVSLKDFLVLLIFLCIWNIK
jgi:RNA polymerase sigma-70 factor (ECF subfamily)